MPRSLAKLATSSPVNRRSSSRICNSSPRAAHRDSGTGGSVRPASTRWPFEGSASTSSASQVAPGRPGRDEVDVVEHEAHRRRAPPPDQVGHGVGGGRAGRVRRAAGVGLAGGGRSAGHGGAQVASELRARRVGGLDAQPHVVAARREAVLGHRLGEQRRLAEPGAAHDGRHPVLPAAQQHAQQARAGERRRPRAGGLEPERSRHPAARLVVRRGAIGAGAHGPGATR